MAENNNPELGRMILSQLALEAERDDAWTVLLSASDVLAIAAYLRAVQAEAQVATRRDMRRSIAVQNRSGNLSRLPA